MIKNKIREYRLEKGLSMKELAQRSNISIGYLSHLENGSRENPSTEVMKRIAKALDETIIEVFFWNID